MSDGFAAQQLAQIRVEELAQRLNNINTDQTTQLQLIDVREPQELAIAQIPGFTNLPLSDFANWSGSIHSQFDAHTETLVLCHHGIRSAQMCQWLISQGFTNVKNISGGIAAYSSAVDPSIPQY